MAMDKDQMKEKMASAGKAAGKAVADAAESVGKMASNTIELAKLKSKIASEQKAIDGLYAQIGERVYQCADEAFAKSAASEEIAQIDEKFSTIKDCLYRSAELKGLVVCPTCGKECSDEDEFCAKCGTKLAK